MPPTGGSVVAVVNVPREQVSSYGVIDPAGALTHDGVIPVKDLVEKPSPEDAPSNFILTGRYVLTADAWDEIDRLTPGRGGELQLTDALRAQAARSPFHAVVSDESRHDTGTPLGFLTSSIELGLARSRTRALRCATSSSPARLTSVGAVTRTVGRDVSAAEAFGIVVDEAVLVDVEIGADARLRSCSGTAEARGARRRADGDDQPSVSTSTVAERTS